MPHSHIVLDLTLSVTGMQERMSIDRPTNLLGAFAFGMLRTVGALGLYFCSGQNAFTCRRSEIEDEDDWRMEPTLGYAPAKVRSWSGRGSHRDRWAPSRTASDRSDDFALLWRIEV
jgi:hypothetical protein